MEERHPVVRRRPRGFRTEQPHAVPRQTSGERLLVIVTDDPAFPELQADSRTRIWRWAAAHTAAPGHFSGDPLAPVTYAWLAEHSDVTVIVALADHASSSEAAQAVLQAQAQAAILVVTAADSPATTQPLFRTIDARSALHASLEIELHRLDTLKRVRALRAFAAPFSIVPVLLHRDPDPDALASALAVRLLLRRTAQEAPIVTLDEMTRPENRRMAELLDIQVTQVTSNELNGFAGIICVDMQPRRVLTDARIGVAIIDHHPYEYEGRTGYLDIRPHYGATATILTEYLRAEDERRINKWLATGLAYAIKTDTDNLSRGVNPADVSAYAFLLDRADAALLRRIERPALSSDTARAFGQALAGLLMHDGLAVAWLDKLPVDESHILADVADFCLAIEEITWAAAAAIVEGRLVINLRHLGAAPGAGSLAHALSIAGGAGGGHAAMARAVLPLVNEWGALLDAPRDIACKMLLERLVAELEHIRSV